MEFSDKFSDSRKMLQTGIFFCLFLLSPILLAVACQSKTLPPTETAMITSSVLPQATEPTSPVSPASFSTMTATNTLPTETSTPGLSELSVLSNLPGATVYLGETEVGSTPYQDFVRAGIYTVTVALVGFHPWQEVAIVRQNEPLALTAEFTFTPHIEQLLDECIDHFWWSADGQAVYYIRCQYLNFRQTGKRREEGPVWRLDLVTQEISQVEDAWPPEWVPHQYKTVVPETIPPWLISVSPSGQKVFYLEETLPDPSLPTATPQTDPQGVDPEPFMPKYVVHVVLDQEIVLELGTINELPDMISWSSNEQRIFIPSYAFSGHEQEGWLIDLMDKSIKPLTPPPHPNIEHVDFLNASILPDGRGILYKPNVEEPYRIWYFDTGEEQMLMPPDDVDFGWYCWLPDNRHLIFIGGKAPEIVGLFWYDLQTGEAVLILDNEYLPPIANRRLSPQGDELIFGQYNSTGGLANGLWLLTLDTN